MIYRLLFALCCLSCTLLASASELSENAWAKLQQEGWDEHVGGKAGIWVSAGKQRLSLIKKGKLLQSFPCSTSFNGTGNRANSNQTPLGWHMVADKFGNGLPWGAILVERKYTGRIWSPSQPTSDDLILTRILRLQGLEPGLNQGAGIDSYDRYIYIHGTAEEHKLGKPASHGCIRLSNSDVILLFDQAPLTTPVLITEW
jgi:lipoprotein-anchoring transpeptidase ErfK/SrfK